MNYCHSSFITFLCKGDAQFGPISLQEHAMPLPSKSFPLMSLCTSACKIYMCVVRRLTVYTDAVYAHHTYYMHSTFAHNEM